MPFAAHDRPSLSAGLLQAALERCGIACDVKYFNVTLWRLLGEEAYGVLSRDSAMIALPGEWVFSQLYYGTRCSNWDSYEREVLAHPIWGVAGELRPLIRDSLEMTALSLRLAFESDDWSRYNLVGFSSTFQQTMPSMCLARMIRERYPHVLIAAGGGNFAGEMARPYMEHFDFLDFVATGEADASFPRLCRNLRDFQAGRSPTVAVPSGFLYRAEGKICASPAPDEVRLDDLPLPNYDSYFRVACSGPNGTARPADPVVSWLPVEASRGCWWGQKCQCTFCGLNGEGIRFRRKSWRRVVAETDELSVRYGTIPLQFSDNILGMDFFSDLIPFWAGRRDARRKFLEVKANLRYEHLRLLREAGVCRIQAGVESLADHTLQVMNKGVSAAHNVALLRWSAELGIVAAWNLIFGFPREELADYEPMEALLRQLTHLHPPAGVAPIRMDRFSPNHGRWREQGFSAIAPTPAYRHIFPFSDRDLRRVAYYFDYEHPQFAAALAAGERLTELGNTWRDKHLRKQSGELAVKPHLGGGFVLIDSRYNFAPSARRLSEQELALLLACDAPTGRGQALRRARATVSSDGGASANGNLEATLVELIKRCVIAEVGPRLITLALLPPREQGLATSAA